MIRRIYEIDDCKTVEEITYRLAKIDFIIGKIFDYIKTNKCGLFISSLYGIQKELYNEKHMLCKVNFSNRVPAIIYDESISKSKYGLREGNIYDLSNAIIYNMNNNYKNSGILKKKGALSIFFKK